MKKSSLKNKKFHVCVVCSGRIVKDFKEVSLDHSIVIGKIYQEESNGDHCEDCGIHYDKLPNKKAIERLRKKDESILQMSVWQRKNLPKKWIKFKPIIIIVKE